MSVHQRTHGPSNVNPSKIVDSLPRSQPQPTCRGRRYHDLQVFHLFVAEREGGSEIFQGGVERSHAVYYESADGERYHRNVCGQERSWVVAEPFRPVSSGGNRLEITWEKLDGAYGHLALDIFVGTIRGGIAKCVPWIDRQCAYMGQPGVELMGRGAHIQANITVQASYNFDAIWFYWEIEGVVG